jgi:hypothetical protein
MTNESQESTSAPSPVATRGRLRFRLIYVAPLLALLALGSWAFSSPIGSSPDDDFHLTSIWCANDARTDLCAPGPTPAERVVPPAVLSAPCFAYDETKSGSCQFALLDKPTEPSVTTDRGSFQANYPPVYYAFMNTFASDNLLVSALAMRLVNILLIIGITAALYTLLPHSRRSSLLWGWLITMVPLGLFLVASNNPSSWAIIGVGTSWLALVGYFETSGVRRWLLGGLFALTVTMAAGARADAAIYTILGSAVAIGLTVRRGRISWLLAILPAVFAVIALLFFFASRQSTVVTGGLGSDAAADIPLSGFGLLAFNLLNVPELWAGVFGGWPLGWLDTGLPAIVVFGGLGVFVAVVFVGIGVMSWRKEAAALALVLVLWLLPTYVLMAGGNAVGQNVQPRYLLPLIIMLAGVAVFTVGQSRVRLTRVQTVLVGVTLAITQSVSLHINIRRYITGVDIQGANLNEVVEWWWRSFPFTPMALWAIGSLSFAALVLVLLRDLRKSSYEIYA